MNRQLRIWLIFSCIFLIWPANAFKNASSSMSAKDAEFPSENNAEAILEKALREFRSKVASNQQNQKQEKFINGEDFANGEKRVDFQNGGSENTVTDAVGRKEEIPTGNSIHNLPSPQPNAPSADEVMNFVVRANDPSSNASQKFEFLPHFEKDLYEFMAPEGINTKESVMAIVNFIGAVKNEMPKFHVESETLNLFEIGNVNTIQSANYIQCKVPILLRRGVFVNASEIPENTYQFKINAVQGGHESQANIKVEILTFATKTSTGAPISLPPTPQEVATSLAIENDVKRENEVKNENDINSVSEPTAIIEKLFESTPTTLDEMGITFSMEAEGMDLVLGSGSLATRSATMPDEEAKELGDVGTTLADGSHTKRMATENLADTLSAASAATDSADVINLDSLPAGNLPVSSDSNSASFAVTVGPSSSVADLAVDIATDKDSAATDISSMMQENGHIDEMGFLSTADGNEMPMEFTDGTTLLDPLAFDTDKNLEFSVNENVTVNEDRMDSVTSKSVENVKMTQNEKLDTIHGENIKEDQNQPGTVHIHDQEEVGLPKEEPSSSANAQPENLINPDEMPKVEETGPNSRQISADETLQNFSSQGIQIDLRGAENSKISIPFDAKAMNSIEGVTILLSSSGSENEVPDEVFEFRVNPAGILDVKPHFAMRGQPISLMVVDPSLFQTDDSVEQFKFTVDASFADPQLKARQPSPILASRDFMVERGSANPSQMAENQQIRFHESYYEFHVAEMSKSGKKIGEISAVFPTGNKIDAVQFEFRGNGAKMFAIDENGAILLACLNANENCLDKESVDIFNLVAIANYQTSTVAVPITIHVDDVNDNGPTLKVFDKEIHVVDDEILTPFLIYMSDADSAPENRKNEIEFDGSAAEFLSAEKISAELSQAKVTAFASAGIYTLIISARDKSANNSLPNAESIQVNVIVKGDSPKIRFGKSVYERTIIADRLNKGNPLVQLDLKGIALDSVSFTILDGNPGWLAIESYSGNVYVGDVPKHNIKSDRYLATIGAVEQDTQKVLAKCQVVITVVGSKQNEFLFKKPLYSIIISKDENLFAGLKTLPIAENLSEENILKILPETVEAFDESAQSVALGREQIVALNERNEITLSAVKSNENLLKNIQQIYFQIQNVENERDKALICISLSSQSKNVLMKLREMSRPKFSAPWLNDSTPIKLRIPEEFPQNHILVRLPAFNPLTGTPIANYTLSGPGAHYFSVDPTTASIQIQERIDFEALSFVEQKSLEFELHATNAESEYIDIDADASNYDSMSASAKFEVQIFDVDDSAPKLKLNGSQRIEISENAKAGQFLAQFGAVDSDSKKLKYFLSGSSDSMENFRIQQKGDSQAIVIASEAKLDREENDRFIFVITCVDPAGNKDQLQMEVILTDENDNRPLFTAQSLDTVDVHAYDNWPAGIVLAKFEARDKDIGENARITYSFVLDQKMNDDYFTMDKESGILSTAKSLAGLASERSYSLSVVATDHGTPSFSSSTRLHVHVHDATQSSDFDDKLLRFTEPNVDFVLELPEDIAVGRKVLEAEARMGGSSQTPAIIKYSIKASNKSTDFDDWFSIDESTGELFTKAPLDYELQKFITVEFNK